MSDFDFNEIADALYKRADGIPFDNSDFQCSRFIEQAGLTPERRQRTLLLNATKVLENIKTNYYSLKRENIELKILARKLDTESDALQRELLKIDIAEKQAGRIRLQKLVKDAEHRLHWYTERLKEYPQIDRALFESGEQDYFESSLLRQIKNAKHGQAAGAVDSMAHMLEYDPGKLLEAPEQKQLGGLNV